MLFNEPKLLKSQIARSTRSIVARFSALQRAEIAEMAPNARTESREARVSVLFNEPKLLKSMPAPASVSTRSVVSVLFNEPKLLKSGRSERGRGGSFSALQRAEIAEIEVKARKKMLTKRFSALQRAEIAEIERVDVREERPTVFQCSSTSRNC